ncbi:MAG: glutamine-hydrolyzing GMP synthase, partial [Actinomycetota bacterium]
MAADQPILVLDFGAQYAQLIARRIRERRVLSELVPHDLTAAELAARNPAGIVLSGGPASVNEPDAPGLDPAIFDLGVPVLGICYGMFTMAVQQGGQVEASAKREFGYAEVEVHGRTRLLDGIADFAGPGGAPMLKVWMSHGDKVTALPPGFALMASTPSCPIAGMADEA